MKSATVAVLVRQNVFVTMTDEDQVVRLTRQQEVRQARYYRGLLKAQRAEIDADLARDCELLVRHSADDRNRRRMPRLHEAVRLKRREQYQIDCLLESLNRRFFRPQPMPLPDHRFAIEIQPRRHGYRVRIPELDQAVTVASRDDAEMTAREHIAVNINTEISRIAVHVAPECDATQSR
ncbi:hypothetical protein [Mycolicibacterium neworleansense]|uniref:Long chain fatty acid-CoA synthetase Faa4p n=1 Tax=Mycolicibacterium neworleansense TaxID=146018 RepID=A0A0H5RSC6_9MYCO|nr:hypothetical protein [Mycolicibacterium neworleansense]MCV7361472.1 hypothetical protein [Mycolicibacterium neworleansense]CRZ16823.1 long chain fatty acid-CoA synthetase Faa4p [Mycolicibacterium neworleansense]